MNDGLIVTRSYSKHSGCQDNIHKRQVTHNVLYTIEDKYEKMIL